MNAMRLSGTIIFVCLAVVILLAAVGPCLVQDRTTGNSGGAVENIKTSVEQTNDALEDGPLGEFFQRIDNANN
jgi:hypothetical protein